MNEWNQCSTATFDCLPLTTGPIHVAQ